MLLRQIVAIEKGFDSPTPNLVILRHEASYLYILKCNDSRGVCISSKHECYRYEFTKIITPLYNFKSCIFEKRIKRQIKKRSMYF